MSEQEYDDIRKGILLRDLLPLVKEGMFDIIWTYGDYNYDAYLFFKQGIKPVLQLPPSLASWLIINGFDYFCELLNYAIIVTDGSEED